MLRDIIVLRDLLTQINNASRGPFFKQNCGRIMLYYLHGIKWDGENRCFRTDGENVFLAKIALVGASAGD
jgi:hypothetical protein